MRHGQDPDCGAAKWINNGAGEIPQAPAVNMSVLIIEGGDTAREAAEALRATGWGAAQVIATLAQAEYYLRELAEDGGARPELIVLDLLLPDGSGHEILRLCRSDKYLDGIPILVWTADGRQREICQCMGVKKFVLRRRSGTEELAQALRELRPARQGAS